MFASVFQELIKLGDSLKLIPVDVRALKRGQHQTGLPVFGGREGRLWKVGGGQE